EILEKYRPENMDGEVPDEIEREYVQVQRLELPTDMGSGTEISWSAAPKAIARTDRFVAVACNGDQERSILFDYEVRRDLSVGPDPLLDQDDEINVNTETGDLLVNEDLKWMVDFEKAIEAGMGAKINLSTEESIKGFDKLFVIGLRTSSNE